MSDVHRANCQRILWWNTNPQLRARAGLPGDRVAGRGWVGQILQNSISRLTDQGHPTDRFGKLSFRKALDHVRFVKGILTSNFRDMGNLRPSVFGFIQMSFRKKVS